MEAHAEHADGHHHEIPAGGAALTGVAISATLHCLTGCAIGEVTGMAIATALGFSNFASIALAVVLAFAFGYALTSIPLLRAGLALAVVVPIALASDTLSIATMEVVDNAVVLLIPGAIHAGLDTLLFWGSLAFSLAVAFVLTVPVNRWLLARGKGHTAVHETGIHGGPPTRLVAAGVIAAAVFGTAVLVGEIVKEDTPMSEHGSGEMAMSGGDEGAAPGLAVASSDLSLELGHSSLPLGTESELRFRIAGADGAPITDFDLEHEKRMHLIVVRRDLTGFQHLHPRMSANGVWSTPIELPAAGSYRVFADFTHDGVAETLGADLAVDGDADYHALPFQQTETEVDGYDVGVEGTASTAGTESELTFNVLRDGRPVEVEPYLGADGHLVALRDGDLAFLHVHPLESDPGAGSAGGISFATEFPTAGQYRLFFQFRDRGEIHTAEFTRDVGR